MTPSRPSRPAVTPEVPPDVAAEVKAISDYNDLVLRNFRNSRVLEGLASKAGARLTRATFDVLAVINRQGTIRVSRLAERLEVDQSTVSRQIRPLEELGLIVRSEDPDDRRVVWLTVTDAGREVIQRVKKMVHDNVEAALATWSPDDRELLGTLLERFRRSVLDLSVLDLPPADR
jgi:DNA-binding MarR family transcriptional regulator